MQKLRNQLITDLQNLKTRFSRNRKLSIKTVLLTSVILLTSIGLLVGLYVSNRTTEDRSAASGTSAQMYFSPASIVLTKDAQGNLQPITFDLLSTVGKPIANYSVALVLTDSTGHPLPRSYWDEHVNFRPNEKFTTNAGSWFDENPTKVRLFTGTIGQKAGGVTRLADTVTDGKIGTFVIRPEEQQQDLVLRFYIFPTKPMANALYLLGNLLNPPVGNGEVQFGRENLPGTFTLHNPFIVSTTPSPTPANSDINQARLQYVASSGGTWHQLPSRFNQFNAGGTVKSLIRLSDIDPSWRVDGLSPAFRLRVKNAQGVYRQTTVNGQTTNVLVNYQPNGSIASGQFWVNWDVVANNNEIKFIQQANTTSRLQFDPGDTVEVMVNLRREQNGVSYVCTENNQLIVAPIGRPEEQQVLGPCRNSSLVTVSYTEGLTPNTCQCDLSAVVENACNVGVTATCTSQVNCICGGSNATPTPTPTTPASVTSTPTPTPTVAPTPYVPQTSVNYRMSTAENWTLISGATNTFEFRPGMTLRMNLNRGSVRPLYSALPAGTTDIAAFRLRIFDHNNQQRGSTLVHEGIIGASGNFIQDYKIVTENSTNVIKVLDGNGQPIAGQSIQFNNGDKLDIRVNMKWLEASTQQVSSCTESNQYVKYPNGRPNEQVIIGPCLNQSIKTLIWWQ